MNQQLKTAGILAGVLLALGGLATWDEWQTKKDEKKKETENRLFTFEPDKVTGIEFSNREGTAPVDISIERASGKWQITRPSKLLADQQAVDNLLTTLKDYKFESVVADDASKNASAFGLDKPRRVIELKTEKGTAKIAVGSNTPVGYSVYSLAEGPGVDGAGKVHVGSQHLAVSTGKTLHDLRDKKFLTFSNANVAAFELIRPGKPTVKLEKKDGAFAVTAPQSFPAEQNQVFTFLDGIVSTNASTFFDHPDSKLQNAFKGRNIGELRVRLDDKTSVNVKFVEYDKKIHAWTGGTTPIVQVPDDIKGKLEKTASDFRDRKIFSFVGDKVTEVILDGKSFSKKNAEWYGSDEPTKAISQIRSLLVDLEFAKATEILDAKDKASRESTEKAPVHTVKLTIEGSSQPIEIKIWDKAGSAESFLVRHSEAKAANTVYSIGKASLSALDSTKKSAAPAVDLGHD
ncbi:DUF4340 domain-containing protein [bacterium]|nr:DUF4340 domain-containing protein [bacterium]